MGIEGATISGAVLPNVNAAPASKPFEIGGLYVPQNLRPPLSSEILIQPTSESLHIPVDSTPGHQFPITETGQNLGDFADQLLAETRLPLTQVREKAYIPNKYGNHGVLGSWEPGGRHKGRLSFYKDMNRIPAIAQFGVAFHEGAHASSPFTFESSQDYDGEENRLEALENVIAVADQAEQTRVFLNGYHAHIYHMRDNLAQLREDHELANKSDEELHALCQEIYIEETHAIASEIAVTNYQHLQHVEKRQFAALQAMGREQEFVPLTSRTDEAGKLHESGIDKTLKILTKFDDVDQMHRYFRGIRAKYGGTKTPFHDVPNEPFPFAPIIPGTETIVIYVVYVRRSRPDILETDEDRLRKLRRYFLNIIPEE